MVVAEPNFFSFVNGHEEMGYRLKPGHFVNPNSYLEPYFYTAAALANHSFYEQPTQRDREIFAK